MSEKPDYLNLKGHGDAAQDHGHDAIAPLPHKFHQAQSIAGMVGLIGLGMLLILGLLNWEHFFRSLLFAFHFWLAISLGCLGFVMISHLTGGGWGAVIRRVAEAGFMNIPLMLVFFFVLTFGYKFLFPWGHMDDFDPSKHMDLSTNTPLDPGLDAAYGVLLHRWPLYQPFWFTVRTVGYFVIWCLLAFSLRGGSIRLDRGPDLVLRRRMRKISALGMVLFFVTATGYALDYISGRETNWYSSILGFITAIGLGISGMSFVSLVVCLLADKKPLKDVLIPQHLNDLGNILLALVILWMYTTFAQFLIQWNGNMPEDISYYTNRGLSVVGNGWAYIAILLLLGNFFVPFFLLLQKPLKRNPATFARIAVLLLVMRFIHELWLFAPSGPHRSNPWIKYPSTGRIYLTDFAAWAGVGGVWIYFYVRTLASQRLLARNVANEPEILTHGLPAHA